MKTMNNAVLGVMFATTAFVAGCALRGESWNSANAARTTKANAATSSNQWKSVRRDTSVFGEETF